MAYSFEEIMAYHPDNKDVYSEVKENLSNLVPFVGAGLTQFAYPSWKHALTELANKITNKTDSRQVKKLIKDGYYMDAAQQLEKLRTPSNLARDIAHLFSSDHLANKMGELPKEAVSMLPWLFNGLVLTTNFDETLETVYRECGCTFQTVSHPGHQVLEQFIRNQNYCGLFKMHGTVTGNLIEYDNIVFTSAQYDRHYGKDSPLIHDLKACFGKRLMFFLGCSLEKDRTMDILQDDIIQGVNHYAIIGCKKSEKDEKARKLGEKYIRVILYEQGRHEAVRVILEHLLEETKPDIYQKIRPVGALKSSSPSSRFSYDAEIVPLSGRKEELDELNKFLQTPDIPFQWWAITGPGGCGKSRLAYEFQNQLPIGWHSHYLKPCDYANLHGMSACLTQKTLLIADYVQEHARELGEWMESLNSQPRSLPIRLLLVEREAGIGPEDSAWTKQLYSDVHNEIKLKETCYQKNFLNLSPLSDQDLLDITENYVSAMQGHKWKAGGVLTNKTKQILLQKLKAIDPDLCRPLYAMFLADAYVDSNDIEQWKRKDILDYVISRERKMLQFSIRNVMHTNILDQKLYNACIYLQCVATTLQDISVENLQELFPDIWKIIEDRAVYFESAEEFLYQVGLIVEDELPALRPDLVGEYFVYDWLFQSREKKIQNFIFTIWEVPVVASIFLQRLVDDFHHLLNEYSERWDILFPESINLSENSLCVYAILVSISSYYCSIFEQCEKFVSLLEKYAINYPNNLDIVTAFANGLFNLINKQDEQGAERTIRRLEKLYAEYSNVEEIAVYFANGLFNFSNKQDGQDAERTVRCLEKLYAEHPNNTTLIVIFAKDLVNLICEQDGQDAERTVERLEKLYAEHPDNPDLVTEFASSLYNLSNRQDEKSAEYTVGRLEKFSSEHSDNPDLTIIFAKSLVNLSNRQDEQGSKKSVRRLEKLLAEHPSNSVLAVFFAKSLVNLSNRQDEQGVERTIRRLEKLLVEHPENSDLAVFFAIVLYNLSNRQDKQSAEKTIGRLMKLSAEHHDLAEIAIYCANGLFNLSNRQDEQSAKRTIEYLEKLSAEHHDVMEIATEFAKGLFNLSNRQEGQGAEKTVGQLEKLYVEYSDETEITTAFANGLFNLSNRQIVQSAEKTVGRLEKLYADHSENPDLAVLFAKSLVNLSNRQDEQDAKRNVSRLEKLYAKHPDNSELAAEFANNLFNLSNRQDEQSAERIIGRLEKLYAEHSDNPDLAVVFANSLFNLSNRQDEQNAERTIGRLEKLSTEHPDNSDLAAEFANGLFNLSNRQDEQSAKRTVSRLEKLSAKHPNNQDLAYIFAKGLFNLICEQDGQGAEMTVGCLEKLSAEYPDNLDLSVLFAMGLFNLICKQDEHGVERTMKRIEILFNKNQDLSSFFNCKNI